MIINSNKFQDVFLPIIKKLNYPSKIAIALSGGVDSMCLTHLLNQYYNKMDKPQSNLMNTEIISITIDHNLREESSEEALKIRNYVRKTFPKIKPIIGTINLELNNSNENFELLARVKRYLKLKEICENQKVDAIFVGHNLDDSIETYMLRKSKVKNPTDFYDTNMWHLYEANKIYSLGSIKSISDLEIHENTPFYYLKSDYGQQYIDLPHIKLVRPLLDFYKKDLYETCNHCKIQWVEDHTNFDPKITERNQIRHDLSSNQTIKENIQSILVTNDRLLELEYDPKKVEKYSKIVFNYELSAASINFDCNDFLKLNPVVINKWLFEQLKVISAAEKYHYKFLRIYDLAYKIHEFIIKKTQKRLCLSYLNMSFNIIKDNNKLFINVIRQNPVTNIRNAKMRKEISCNQNEFTNWINFDNRFLFRFKPNKDMNLLLHSYYPDMKQDFLENLKIISEDKKFMKKLCQIIKNYHIPVLSNTETGNVIGVPSLGIMDESIQYEWGK